MAKHGIPDPANAQGPLGDLQEVIADVTAGQLGEMADQLSKTISYLTMHRSNLIPTRLWLLGGGATVKNAAAFLSSRVAVPVEVWRMPDHPDGDDRVAVHPEEMLGNAVALSALAWAK